MLLWVALCYTKHNGIQEIDFHLKPYDEVDYISTTGIPMGGANKGDCLSTTWFPKFESDPLDRLIDALRQAFSARYGGKYSAERMKEVRDFVALQGIDLDPNLLPVAFVYGARLDSLKEPNWLVEVFNEHLKANDWLYNDKAKANLLVSTTVSSQKRTSQQAALEERAIGSITKRKLG